MKQHRQNLKVMFHAVQPEVILDSLCRTKAAPMDVNSRQISLDEYLHFSKGLMPGRSLDEIENFYHLLCQELDHPPEHGRPGVFQLLFQFGRQTLKLEQNQPVCRFSHLLSWRSVSHRLGQDILTTAFLAWSDWRAGIKSISFSWPAVIKTDNRRLQDILDQGLSENHFHLNGSSQSFALSWACLMNHPIKIPQFFSKAKVRHDMRQGLTATVLSRPSDHMLPWEKRLLFAAWLRAMLFRRFFLNGPQLTGAVIQKFFLEHMQISSTESLVQYLRFRYGKRVSQPNGTVRCLDYIFPGNSDGHNRLLAGERHFLYTGFYLWLRGEMTDAEADLFYLYLLLKSQFRGELVQINGRVGFKNFSLYQDRKEHFWEDLPEYKAEGRRLAVSSTLHDNAIQSLEARISPKKRSSELLRSVTGTDRLVCFSETGSRPFRPAVDGHPLRFEDSIRNWAVASRFFYVVHFIKGPEEDSARKDDARWRMRNHDVRVSSRQMALALANGLEHSSYLRERIWGIDAASFEIGCRPETFATEFRYLRNHAATISRGRFRVTAAHLSATYHVGEDFLDIADGLRAIDEAIRFLPLTRGDRLGHALALGISPERFYADKDCIIPLSKQDRLDNLVWLIYRSMDFGIQLDMVLLQKLRSEAEKLFESLYKRYCPLEYRAVSLDNYYESMSLRGDHPELYMSLGPPPWRPNLPCSYRDSMEADAPEELRRRRGRPELRLLCHLYHFCAETKKQGREIVLSKVDKPYITLMRTFQGQLQRYIGNKGIMIECNPTSNYLIGTFHKYDEHPIFRFNGFGFDTGSPSGQLQVSVNTDDQGVFDTSLENEYALLACCMSKAKQPDGSIRYPRDVIYQYLNHVRGMGNGQSFRRQNERR